MQILRNHQKCAYPDEACSSPRMLNLEDTNISRRVNCDLGIRSEQTGPVLICSLVLAHTVPVPAGPKVVRGNSFRPETCDQTGCQACRCVGLFLNGRK